MKGNSYKYQIIVVLSPKLAGEDKEKILTKLEGLIEGQEAKVSEKEALGTKELAYEIKKMSKGDFWVFKVEGPKPIELKEINLFLNREIGILRYLILKE